MALSEIRDEGDPRKYYTQVPNMIDDSDLSVYAFRLYVHMKRVAGDKGTCYQTTDTLAKACKMSAGSVKKAKSELEAAGLITVVIRKGEHGEFDGHTISIRDVWAANMASYSPVHQVNRTGSPHEQDLSHDVNRTGSPGELKNNPIKNNPIKKNKEEGGEEEDTHQPQVDPPPPPHLRPERMSDAQEALALWTAATGMMAYGGYNQDTLPTRLLAIIKQEGGFDAAAALCKRAYQAMTAKRKSNGTEYSRLSHVWLDWALAHEIPGDKPQGKKIVKLD